MKYTVNEQANEITYDFVVPYDEYSIQVGKALEMLLKQKNEEQMSLNDFIVKYGKEELNHVALNYTNNGEISKREHFDSKGTLIHIEE